MVHPDAGTTTVISHDDDGRCGHSIVTFKAGSAASLGLVLALALDLDLHWDIEVRGCFDREVGVRPERIVSYSRRLKVILEKLRSSKFDSLRPATRFGE